MAGSVSAGAELASRVLDVVAVLPASHITLAQLGAQLTGDAHALDRDRALGRLVDSVLRAMSAVADEESDTGTRGEVTSVGGANDWRRRWARQGVICDDLSVSTLVLNLPTSGTDLIAAVLSDRVVW